jgi:hypothetical protein
VALGVGLLAAGDDSLELLLGSDEGDGAGLGISVGVGGVGGALVGGSAGAEDLVEEGEISLVGGSGVGVVVEGGAGIEDWVGGG